MTIELAIATNENYLPGAIVTLASARIYTPQIHSINVICIHDGLPLNKQKYLIKILNSLNGEINVNFIELDVSKFNKLPKFWTEGGSKLTYARLLLFSLLPSNVQKVLYLDVDLLVKCDLHQLYSINLCGHEIAACVDTVTPSINHDYPKPALDFQIDKFGAYFNAGVILIDISSVRRSNSFINILKMLNNGSNHSFKYHDQSALNYYYQGSFLKLDEMWNIQLHSQCYSQNEQIQMLDQTYQGIFHFVSKSKPWNSFSYNPFFLQHIRFLNKIAPSWKSVISYHKEKKFKVYQKKFSFFMIARSLFLFLISPADEKKMTSLLYWVKLHQQKNFFAKIPVMDITKGPLEKS